MSKVYPGALAICAIAACAGSPVPHEHLAASMAAVRGAETAGAAQFPQAALHLKLASEQIEAAKNMIAKEDNERANSMSIRAFNDAELALALTREAQAKQSWRATRKHTPKCNLWQSHAMRTNRSMRPILPAWARRIHPFARR